MKRIVKGTRTNSRIGFQALFDFTSIRQSVEFAKHHGFGHVELHLNNIRFYEELERSAGKSAIPVLVHAADGFNLFQPDAAVREASVAYLVHQLELARRIGARCLTFHLMSDVPFAIDGIKHFTHQFFPKECHRWVRKGLLAVSRRATGRTKLCLENTAGFRYEFVREIADELLGKKLFLTWDFGHTNCLTGKSRQRELTYFRERRLFVTNCHLHDNNQQADQHRPIGTGTVDFSALYSIVKEADPYLTLEIRPKGNTIVSLSKLKKILR